MATVHNDGQNAPSEEAKTMEEEYRYRLKELKDIQKKLQKHENSSSSLTEEKASLQEKTSQWPGGVPGFDELVAKNKNLEAQLLEKDRLLDDERKQRQQLEEKLRQSDEDMVEAMYLTEDLEEKLAKIEKELSEKEKALKELSAEHNLEATVRREAALAVELKATKELLDELREENQRLST